MNRVNPEWYIHAVLSFQPEREKRARRNEITQLNRGFTFFVRSNNESTEISSDRCEFQAVGTAFMTLTCSRLLETSKLFFGKCEKFLLHCTSALFPPQNVLNSHFFRSATESSAYVEPLLKA